MAAELRVKRGGLPFQEIDGQAVVVVPSRREMHELDETATFLWRELERARSVADLVAALCGEFDVDPGRAEKDVRAFIAGLEEKGLVVRS